MSIAQELNRRNVFQVAAALALAAFDRFVLAPRRNAAEIERALQESRAGPDESPKAAAEPGPSIGGLPFVNLSYDPAQECFSDGIADELLNVLARYPDLRVAARTSSFRFKDTNLDTERWQARQEACRAIETTP